MANNGMGGNEEGWRKERYANGVGRKLKLIGGQVGTDGVTTRHLPIAREELLDAGDLTS
jgi:hypothetical protein